MPVVMCAGVSTAGYDDLLWLVIVPFFFFFKSFLFPSGGGDNSRLTRIDSLTVMGVAVITLFEVSQGLLSNLFEYIC